MIRGAEPQDANVDPLLKYPSPRAFIMINGRDHRIDFFRGLALVFIFWDHIPGNPLANLTVRNFGFSDAAEIFVFLAGYAAQGRFVFVRPVAPRSLAVPGDPIQPSPSTDTLLAARTHPD